MRSATQVRCVRGPEATVVEDGAGDHPVRLLQPEELPLPLVFALSEETFGLAWLVDPDDATAYIQRRLSAAAGRQAMVEAATAYYASFRDA